MTTFYLGTLNRPGPYLHATGEGVVTCALDEASGEIQRVGACPRAENAIWLARAGRTVLVAGENYYDPGGISAWRPDGSGELTRVGGTQSSLGGAICHMEVSRDQRVAIVSSYLGGVTVHALGVDGAVAPAHQHIVYQGSGADPRRQEMPHPHQATLTPDGTTVLVCDLGCDCLWAHAFDGMTLGDARRIDVAAGSGPRHLVFHPSLPRFYLLGELDAKVREFDARADGWQESAVHDALPAGFTGEPAGSGIRLHPSGNMVFAANRNSDTVACFAIGARGGLVRTAVIPVHGRTPRDIVISPSGRWLISVNQDSHEVMPIGLDAASGQPTGVVGPAFACGSPFCALF